MLWFLVATLAFAASLLVFPSALLWMVAFWLAVASIVLSSGRVA
jgi:hypothetical protein